MTKLKAYPAWINDKDSLSLQYFDEHTNTDFKWQRISCETILTGWVCVCTCEWTVQTAYKQINILILIKIKRNESFQIGNKDANWDAFPCMCVGQLFFSCEMWTLNILKKLQFNKLEFKSIILFNFFFVINSIPIRRKTKQLFIISFRKMINLSD